MTINERLQTFKWYWLFLKVATFQNIFFLPINSTQSSEYFSTNFMIFLLLLNTFFFVYFPAEDWFADSRVFGIYILLNKIILPWEVIFQIKPRILEGNNFLKGHFEFSELDLFPIKNFQILVHVLQISDLWINFSSSILLFFTCSLNLVTSCFFNVFGKQ